LHWSRRCETFRGSANTLTDSDFLSYRKNNEEIAFSGGFAVVYTSTIHQKKTHVDDSYVLQSSAKVFEKVRGHMAPEAQAKQQNCLSSVDAFRGRQKR
jgi:hypothetical protein